MKHSLIRKTIRMIVCITVAMSALALAIYARGIYKMIVSQYGQHAIDITNLVAGEIDAERLSNVKDAVLDIYEHSDNKVMSDQWGTPEFEAYTAQFESIKEMDDYKAILADLRRMQGALNVNCLYIFWVDKENECYIYLIDAALEDPCPIGCIDPLFFDNVSEALENISAGSPPNVTNTPEYGWLISAGMPIYDSRGEVVALSAVDISMNDIVSRQTRFMLYIVLAFIIMTLLVCILGILLVNHFLVKPINTLSQAASQYKNNKNAFSELNFKRSDEIGTLAESMVQMEKDIDRYITDLTSAREHADMMDREANIDALTNVGNKRSYDIEAKRLGESKMPYGIVLIDMNDLKGINDTYGHEKGDIGINTTCQLICRVFTPSSVYRIGGDEFIVILENKDYENRDALVQELSKLFMSNKSNDSLPPWKRVSAAVGCAVYDPGTDEGAESVMQRADAEMYKNKKEIKEAE